MTKKKITILLGHPNKDSLLCHFSEQYERGAKEAGHEVKMINISDLTFDPILHKGYKEIQELEPDLKKVQEDIAWCDHFVIFYPAWWSTMPALLKGLFDRIWLPGFAFKFPHHGLMWTPLMRGKTAEVFVGSDSHPLIQRFIFGDTTNEIRKGILWFAGFKTKVSKIGPLKHITPEKVLKYDKMFIKYGKRAK